MDRSGIRDDVAPWSFFLPVTLAVIVGGVLVGLILRTVDRVFVPASSAAPVEVNHEPAARPLDALPAEPAPQQTPTPTTLADEDRLRTPAATQDDAPSTAVVVPVLPGAIVAKRDGAPEACINGSIALRAENGWEQRLENDAPVPCIEASVSAR